jgi:hypothetical protein
LIGPPKPISEEQPLDQDEKFALDIYQNKIEKKKYKKHKEMVEEELVPKNTGREAMVEKKKMKAQYTKSKETDDVELNDKQIFGGSDFDRRVQVEKERNERKIIAKLEAREKAMTEYQRKEEEKLAPFKLMLQSGQIPLLNNKFDAK